MILKRIQVEGYKALRNPVELKDLGVGLHLIHGENEIGKSTLLSAVARGFFDRYNSQDQEIKALRPWGTELSPRVTLEFETGGKLYRLEKRFLDEEGSALSEWNGSRFERVADSVKADDRVRGFMLGTASRSGAAGLGNWGLARLLWMTQNLGTRMTPPGLDETLRQHLLGVLGSTVLSGAEQELIAKLDEAYGEYFTAAKGSERKGSPLFEARERLARAEEALGVWKTKWDEVSRWNETALDSQTRFSALETERKRLDAEIASHQIRAREESELENLLKVKDQQLLATLERWKSLNAAFLEIHGLERSLKQHAEKQAELEPRIGKQATELAEMDASLAKAGASVEAASAESSRLAREMAAAALISELLGISRERRELQALEESAREQEKKLQAKRDEYDARKRPKEVDVEAARALQAELGALQARIADQGIEIRVLPERPGLNVRWQTSEGAQSEQASDVTVFRSLDGGELVIPGFGRIAIRSGAEDSKKLKSRLEENQAGFKAKCAAFGVAGMEELLALWTATEELKNEGKALNAGLQSMLSARFKSAADVSTEVARVESLFAEKLSSAAMTEGELADRAGGAVDLRALQGKAATAKSSEEAAIRARSELEARVRAARKGLEEGRTALEAARQGSALLGAQLQSKLSACGGRETLERDLGTAALEKSSLEQERSALASKLPPQTARASVKLVELSRLREDAARREEAARREFDQASALLHHAQGEGYYSKLAAAEEERTLAQETLSQRLAQAQGAKLLRHLTHSKRDRLNSNLLAPVESTVLTIFNEIRGVTAGAGSGSAAKLSFGTDLEDLGVNILAKGEGIAGERSGLDVLSLGTQEQVMFALRLAFGDLLAARGDKPEPQLVVLDDPLVNADPVRQERAREILRRASSKLQILVLTARPEDYRMLKPKEYDLSALKA